MADAGVNEALLTKIQTAFESDEKNLVVQNVGTQYDPLEVCLNRNVAESVNHIYKHKVWTHNLVELSLFEKKRTLDENYQKHSCLIYSHVSRELFSLDFLIIPEFELDFLNLCVLLRDDGQHIIDCEFSNRLWIQVPCWFWKIQADSKRDCKETISIWIWINLRYSR